MLTRFLLARAIVTLMVLAFALRARANEVLIERLAQGQMHADRAVVEARRLAGMA